MLHYAALIFGKENVQEKCLFRVTRNADIDVKEGMMDHDIDYREIMADLLKRRRKLAAVRLQVIPAAPQVDAAAVQPPRADPQAGLRPEEPS